MNKKKLTMMKLQISPEDIRRMDDLHNSGMCDIRTANAVSIALRKRLRDEYKPELVFASNHNSCQLRIGEETCSLPQDLYWWLRDSQSGAAVKPREFSFAIPARWLGRGGDSSPVLRA